MPLHSSKITLEEALCQFRAVWPNDNRLIGLQLKLWTGRQLHNFSLIVCQISRNSSLMFDNICEPQILNDLMLLIYLFARLRQRFCLCGLPKLIAEIPFETIKRLSKPTSKGCITRTSRELLHVLLKHRFITIF